MDYSNSLMKLLNVHFEKRMRLKYPRSLTRFVNPIKMFVMRDQQVIKDAIFFSKVISQIIGF